MMTVNVAFVVFLCFVFVSAAEIEHCDHVIIGGGWSGAYYAWRTTTDQNKYEAKRTCLFEASDRYGGRLYTKSGIPGLGSAFIDVGAYRFDNITHPLVDYAITRALKLNVKCYDPPRCNYFDNMLIPLDGYQAGPIGLINLFVANGGRSFLNHRLDSITDTNEEKLPISLSFTNGLTIKCRTLFLGITKSAIFALNQSSILFTKTTPEAKYALNLPKEGEPGLKQYLIFPQAPWRKFQALREGLFENEETIPPLKGRLHEFHSECYDGSCSGAVLVYYNFDEKWLDTWQKLQRDPSDPYTYIGKGDPNDEILKNATKNFLEVLKKKSAAAKIDFDVSTIPEPTGTVLALWSSNSSTLYPSYSTISTTDSDEYEGDPDYSIRNRVSKPLDGYEIYIANEAYGGGDGWAHPALIMTERILHHHLGLKPHWVVNCLNYGANKYRSLLNLTFQDQKGRICLHWWENQIASHPPSKVTKYLPRLKRPQVDHTPNFDEIKLLFRYIDQQAMINIFDLYNYEDVKANAQDILQSLKDKTENNLPSGMPPDYAWSPQQIALFENWIKGGFPAGLQKKCDDHTITFNPSIRRLFRGTDRTQMLPYDMDLWDYQDVKENADGIYQSVISGYMPPDCKWTNIARNNFVEWQECGMPEGKHVVYGTFCQSLRQMKRFALRIVDAISYGLARKIFHLDLDATAFYSSDVCESVKPEYSLHVFVKFIRRIGRIIVAPIVNIVRLVLPNAIQNPEL